MTDLSTFQFSGNPIIVKLIKGEPWFLGANVCKVLQIKNYSDAYSRLKDYEKTLGNTEGVDNPSTIYISESGLYRLVLTSRKPQAEAFQDWVVKEVLPSIRKNGRYSLNQPIPSTAELLLQTAQVLVDHEKILHEQDSRIEAIESKFITIEQEIAALPPAPEEVPDKTMRAALSDIIKGYAYRNNKSYSDTWRELYSEYRSRYHIDILVRANGKGISGVELASQQGWLPRLYSLAHTLFVPQIISAAKVDAKPLQ